MSSAWHSDEELHFVKNGAQCVLRLIFLFGLIIVLVGGLGVEDNDNILSAGSFSWANL